MDDLANRTNVKFEIDEADLVNLILVLFVGFRILLLY